MTYKEALKTINMNLQVAIHDLEGLEPEYEKNQIEALKISRDALEKQIAKKPFDNGFDNECPYCNTIIYGYKPKYCDICGQKIDWSE